MGNEMNGIEKEKEKLEYIIEKSEIHIDRLKKLIDTAKSLHNNDSNEDGKEIYISPKPVAEVLDALHYETLELREFLEGELSEVLSSKIDIE